MRRKANLVLMLNTNSRTIVQAVVLIVSVTYLLLINRHGALLDTQVYRLAGEQLLRGTDPYEDGFRSGPLGAFFIFLISSIGPVNFSELALGLLNIAGVLLFARRYFISKVDSRFLLFAIVLIWTAPVREMLLDHQIVGICLGLLAVAKIENDRAGSRIITKITAAIPLAIALDLKPQFIAPFVLFYISRNRKYLTLAISIFYIMLFNAALSLHTNTLLIKNQLTVLSQINNSDETGTWRDISNVWTVLDYYLPNYTLWNFLSLVFTFAILMVIPLVAIRCRDEYGIILALTFPVFSIYCHTYDLIPLVAFFVYTILSQSNNTFGYLALLVFLIPYKAFEVSNILFLLALVSLILVSGDSQKNAITMNSKLVSLAALMYFGMNLILGTLSQNQQQVNSRIVTLIFGMSMLVYLKSKIANDINVRA